MLFTAENLQRARAGSRAEQNGSPRPYWSTRARLVELLAPILSPISRHSTISAKSLPQHARLRHTDSIQEVSRSTYREDVAKPAKAMEPSRLRCSFSRMSS